MFIPPYRPRNLKEFDALPQSIKTLFDNTINENVRYQDLFKRAERAKNAGNYVEALGVYKQLDNIRLVTQQKLLSKQEETVSLLSLGLSKERLDKINILSLAIYMACDMIDSLALDINEELKKHDKTARFEMFDPIIKIGVAAKENIRYLWKNTNLFDTDDFGEQSDSMREMLINKAKKVYAKYAKV